MVARQAHNLEVACSSPASATVERRTETVCLFSYTLADNDSLLNTTPVQLNSNSIAILFHPYYKCDGKNVAMPSKSEIGTNQ